MKPIGLAAGLVLALTLQGCGSGSSPPFSLSCTMHRLPSGVIQAAVTVSNNTNAAGDAYIYGPAFFPWLREVHPVLNPIEVVVRPSHGQPVTFFGYAVPRVSPKRPSRVVLVFRPPASPKAIDVTATRTIQTDDLSTVNSSDCSVSSHPGSGH